MLKPIGFWSYSTSDDEHSGQRLSRLRARVAAEFQQLIGARPKVSSFQDKTTIQADADWEKEINEAIAGCSFFVPIVTPAFLQSEWCCSANQGTPLAISWLALMTPKQKREDRA